jgi:ATP-dependent Zn protease
VHKVSIIPRGGRAAESLVFDEVSTGAADDLAKVTDIARAMVVRYGMNEELGNVAYEEERRSFLGDRRRREAPPSRPRHRAGAV